MKRWDICFAIVVAFFILAYTLVVSPMVLFLIVAIGCLFVLSHYLEWGMYILVFLAPMMHWQFRMADVSFIVERYPTLYAFFAPVVDVWAVILLIAYGISLVEQWLRGKRISIRVPGIHVYGLFLFSALVSLVQVSSWELLSSFKYIIRFPLFVYIGYVALGANIINTKIMLHRVMKIFLGSVTVGALMGFFSLFLNIWGLAGLRRAVPFAVAGWAPFGDQHIFLAELLVIAIPMALYFWYTSMHAKTKNMYLWLAVFLTFVCLVTFSRAGWLTLFVEVIIFYMLTRRTLPWNRMIRQYIWVALTLVPFGLYMLIFLSTKVVALSNAARFALTDIAWTLWTQSPLIGQGVGTFVDRVSDIAFFVYEFGTPIDAHSILDKIAAEQGILGIVTFGIFVWWLVSTLYERVTSHWYTKQARDMAFLSVFIILGALCFQLFSTQYYSAKIWVPLMFVIVALRLYETDRHFPVTGNFLKKRVKSIDTKM